MDLPVETNEVIKKIYIYIYIFLEFLGLGRGEGLQKPPLHKSESIDAIDMNLGS